MIETLQDHYNQKPLYEPLDVTITEADVNEAMARYLEFIQLPHDIKTQFFHKDPNRPRTGASGYMHKGELAEDGNPKHDNKHVFHYTPDVGRVALGVPLEKTPRAATLFIDAADAIYYSLVQSIDDKYDEWSEKAPWLSGVYSQVYVDPKDHLRFLAYQKSKDGKLLAGGHYDKGITTVAVAESRRGLRLGAGPDDLEVIERRLFEPIIFPGFGWHQLHEMMGTSTEKKAAWHDVVDIDQEETVSDDVMRWAMVHFSDPAKIYLESTKEQTHTPIPWRNIGRVAMPVGHPNYSFLPN